MLYWLNTEPYNIEMNPKPWCISKQKIMMSPQMLWSQYFKNIKAEKKIYRNEMGQVRTFFLFFLWRIVNKAVQFAIIIVVFYIAYWHDINSI